MINPYAQTFMIASRMDHAVAPRLAEVRDVKPARRGLRLFRLKRLIDPARL